MPAYAADDGPKLNVADGKEYVCNWTDHSLRNTAYVNITKENKWTLVFQQEVAPYVFRCSISNIDDSWEKVGPWVCAGYNEDSLPPGAIQAWSLVSLDGNGCWYYECESGYTKRARDGHLDCLTDDEILAIDGDYFSDDINLVKTAFATRPGDIEVKLDGKNLAPLESALARERWDIAKFLVESGADMEADDAMLTLAVYDSSADMVKYLVEKGIDIESQGESALEFARSFECLAVVEYLESVYRDRGISVPGETSPADAASGAGTCDGKSASDACPSNGADGATCQNIGGGAVSCVARACHDGYYLVHTSGGQSQGWCNACAAVSGADKNKCQADDGRLACPDGMKPQITATGGRGDMCVGVADSQEERDLKMIGDSIVLGCQSEVADVRNSEFAHKIDDDMYYSSGMDRAKRTGVWLMCLSPNTICRADADARYGWTCMKPDPAGASTKAPVDPVQQRAAELEQQRIAVENQKRTQLMNDIRAKSDAVREMENLYTGQKPSVWRNREGNFNTSRLTSDSIAGAVVGTAGGIITFNIVKKNQIKYGYEDLHCLSNGERVGDWGDEVVMSGASTEEECWAATGGRNNSFVWAAANSAGADYTTLVPDVRNPQNNACWGRIDIASDDKNVPTSSMRPHYFKTGQRFECGQWLDEKMVEKIALDAKKTKRTWGTIAGAVGGAAVGVGAMELFGNKLIGGAVMGQKSLSPEELLYSQMTPTERAEYSKLQGDLRAACIELESMGGASSHCDKK